MESQVFGNILLCGRGGTSAGNLRVGTAGVQWKKAGGSRTVDVPKGDIQGLFLTRVSKQFTLGVQKRDGAMISFGGFKEKDVDALRELSSNALSAPVTEETLGVSGQSWGSAMLDGPTLSFAVGNKPAFRLAIQDVSQVQLGKDEVNLEFPIDDTAAADREDALVEMAFHVPKDNQDFPGDDENPAAKVMYNAIMAHADVGDAGGDAVVTFDTVNILNPRGRFDVELYSTFLKLLGQTQEYRIQYDSIVRIFFLPKSAQQTLVVISLDPPIRKGQTYYTHILCQLPADEEISMDLILSDDALKAKNEKCGGKLQKVMEGTVCEVFARVLRGLSGAKLTKPGSFRTADQEGFALRCSYKADDGYLYPLERAFFYIGKPPMLLLYEEITSVEFMRQGAGLVGQSAKTFDILIRMMNDQEYVLRSIQKEEWQNLFAWVTAKELPLENMAEVQQGPHGGKTSKLDLGPDIDAGMAHMQAKGELDDSDEEDEDFDAGGGEEVDSDEDSEADSDVVAEGAGVAGEKKRPAEKTAKAPAAKKQKADKSGTSPAEGKEKKARKKKDKDAPKNAMSAFMYFSNASRERVKTENPGIAFTEISKVIGEEWRKLDAEAKKPYEELAAKDKVRFHDAMKEYKAKKEAEGAAAAEPAEAVDDA